MIKGADAEGLDPRDYRVPTLAVETPDAQAEAELKMSVAALTFGCSFVGCDISGKSVELARRRCAEISREIL